MFTVLTREIGILPPLFIHCHCWCVLNSVIIGSSGDWCTVSNRKHCINIFVSLLIHIGVRPGGKGCWNPTPCYRRFWFLKNPVILTLLLGKTDASFPITPIFNQLSNRHSKSCKIISWTFSTSLTVTNIDKLGWIGPLLFSQTAPFFDIPKPSRSHRTHINKLVKWRKINSRQLSASVSR